VLFGPNELWCRGIRRYDYASLEEWHRASELSETERLRAGDAVDLSGLLRAGIADVAASSVRCACGTDGSVSCWGFRGYGAAHREQQEIYSVDLPPCRSVVAASHFACAASRLGTVHCWGMGASDPTRRARTRGVPVNGTRSAIWRTTARRISGLEGIVEVVAGSAHACARDKRGRVYCWGDNTYGQVSSGPLKSNVVTVPLGEPAATVAANGGRSCVVTETGRVLCWGLKPGTSCDTGIDGALLSALESCIQREPEETGPRLPRAIDLVLGTERACALTEDGDLTCWGYPFGHFDRDVALMPAAIALDEVVAVDLDEESACVVRHDGEVRCWGPLVAGPGRGELTPAAQASLEPPGIALVPANPSREFTRAGAEATGSN